MVAGSRHLATSSSSPTSPSSTSSTPSDLTSGPYDLIGPPRSKSSLRPVKFAVREGEVEERLRELRRETQRYNQEWWERHNRAFQEGREAFIKETLATRYGDQPGKTTLSADEMSTFYRGFMNSQWRNHLEYNKEWQRRNWSIVALSARATIHRLIGR